MSKYLISTLIALSALGCVAVSGNAAAEKLYIYKDGDFAGNHGVWGNVMPARASETGSVGFKPFIEKGHDGKGTAVQVVFDLKQPPNWVGLVIPVEEDYWGMTEVKDQKNVLNLSRANKLVFHAKGEKGGEQIQVKAAISSERFGDSATLPIVSQWIVLENAWQQYEVPVNGSELTRVVTPFVLISNLAHTRARRIKFYVDEIYYELGE